MRDVDDGGAACFQALDDREQDFRFAVGKRRGRLVQNDDVCGLAEALGDFNELALGNRQVADLRARIDRQAKLMDKLFGGGVQLALPDEAEAAWLVIGEDVFGDAEIARQAQFLKDDGNAVCAGIARVFRRIRRAFELYRS